MFDVYYFGENNELLELIPIAKQVKSLDDIKPKTVMFWVVDIGANITDGEIFEYRPPDYDQCYRHVCHNTNFEYVGLQLYPTKTEKGTKRLITNSINTPSYPFTKDPEIFFRNNSTSNNVWVIDDNVDILATFDFTFVPSAADKDRNHVWQKLNPVTKLSYDYQGVKLFARNAENKGRMKYVRVPACKHKVIPVYYLKHDYDHVSHLEEFDRDTDNSLFYVVDPLTEIHPEFKFDYYPTQWDDMNVHVFKCDDGEYKNVRLYPKGTFTSRKYTEEEILSNSFTKLKLIDVVASTVTHWPIISFTNRDEFLEQINNADTTYVWSVDDDVRQHGLVHHEFKPEPKFKDKIHVWQRLNPHTKLAHSYGGVRLWPTWLDYSDITTDQLQTNRIKNVHHVRSPGSTYKPYDVVFISYKDPNAEYRYEQLCEKAEAIWIKDVEGIFEAHKAAAEAVTSKMFWVVDSDAEIVGDFNFSYIPDQFEQETVHVWYSKNPITGQEYGYGGVKLFNTEQVRTATSWGLDFTTGLSKSLKVVPQISCITRFNTDTFSAWRSAFREAVKLTVKDDAESKDRLQGWLHPVPNAIYRHDAKRGAEEGQHWAKLNINNAKELGKINDYQWLRDYYTKDME